MSNDLIASQGVPAAAIPPAASVETTSFENAATSSRERSVSPARFVAPPAWVGSRRERMIHVVLDKLANAMVQKRGAEALRFGMVRDAAQLAAVGRMRRRVYEARLPYMLEELAADGTDADDTHSFVFAAWQGDQVVGTIRLTPYPYETLRHIPEADLSRWLGKGWDTEYVEWSRLLVDSTAGLNRLSPALVTYSGLYVHWLASYPKSFGYIRAKSLESLANFKHEQSAFTFKIPHRGDHSYSLVKNAFLEGSLAAAPRWLSTLMKQVSKNRSMR